jgi:glycosyltransferase involved in cell wall biosynthesis
MPRSYFASTQQLWYNIAVDAQASSAKHIGLNAQLLSLSRNYRGAGINSYIYHLLRHLGQMDSGHRYSVFLPAQVSGRHFVDERLTLYYSRWPTHRPAVRILWEQLAQPVILRRTGVDLLHAMAFTGPLATPCPFVVTIYDLSFLHYPEAFRPWNRWYLSRFTALSARRARRVIAISESTKRDVVRLLGVPANRVDVVYCGADDIFRPLPTEEMTRFRRERALPDRFILFLGTLEPRKNVQTLIRAYGQWRKAEPGIPKLVIAGGKGWYYDQIFADVEALELAGDVIFPGYVRQEELPLWYNAADLFVYPSRFEGFGLPVLEAMACGTPVVTTHAASLPEVAGDAALLVSPDDEAQLIEAMRRALSVGDLRQEMTAKGRAHAANFTWDRTARQTIDTYERALGRK